MKNTNINLIKTENNNMNKNNIKVIIGGPLGILAWSASAGSMLIIFFWGLEKSALAVIAVKTVSWGMWGMGVMRESTCLSSLEARFNRIKPVRKLPTCFSLGLGLYLCSLGERRSLAWGGSLGRLQFLYAYYIPAEGLSPLSFFAETYFRETKAPMTRPTSRGSDPHRVCCNNPSGGALPAR